MTALEQKETIVETSIKKGQQWIKVIPRAAGIKNYENRAKVKKDQRGMLLIKAYVTGQSISWDTSKQQKGTPRTTS